MIISLILDITDSCTKEISLLGITFISRLTNVFRIRLFFVKAMITAGRFYALPIVTYLYRFGHQKTPANWPEDKFCDMLRGYKDNLDLSKEHQLWKLHALTIRRLEDPYTRDVAVDKSLLDDERVLAMLTKLNCCVDPRLLARAYPTFHQSYYLLEEFREIVRRYQCKAKEAETEHRLYTEQQRLYSKEQEECANQHSLYLEQLKLRKNIENSIEYKLGGM